MAFDLLDIIDPLHLRDLATTRVSGKKLRVQINARWLARSWTMPTWDAAYALLESAGKGDKEAKKEIDAIKLAAHGGNADAQAAKVNLDAVSKLIIKGLPKPSTFTASRRRGSPLVPGSGGGAQAQAQRLAATVRKQQEQLRKQQEQLKTIKQQQLERAKRGKLMSQAQQRVAAIKSQAQKDKEALEAELDMVERKLERRDIADDMRKQLEAQAERYEAMIEEIERQKAGAPAAAAVTEATIAERQEAEQDDAAAAYPSAATGDVEFNDAGVG